MTWTNRPNRHELSTPIPILRVRPGKPLGGLVTADDVVGAYTHFWHGRTVICQEHLCEACAAGRVARWYGYLAVWHPTTNNAAILELTPACVPAIEAYRDKYGSLRGAQVQVTRANNRPNARVHCTFQPGPYGVEKLPEPPDVTGHLVRMWEVKAQLEKRTARPKDLPGQTRFDVEPNHANGHPH